jgi:hypothetical protein
MHLSGSSIRLVVSPDVPHDIIERTFEGALIRRMVGVLRTKDGYELYSNNGVENAVPNLGELLDLAKESDSRLAEAALPLLQKAIEENEYLFLDELGASAGIDAFDIADVLQELCRMYPERVDHFEVAWSENTATATPEFGRIGGGADFITADGIESVSAKTWLDEKRREMLQSRGYQPGDRWKKVEGRDVWRALVQHDNWGAIASDEPHDYFEIEKIEITLGGMEYILRYSNVDTPRYFAKAEEAFGAGDRWFRKVTEGTNRRILESMGLPPDEWMLEHNDVLSVRSVRSDLSMGYCEGAWVLYDGGDELGRAEDPCNLLAVIREAEAGLRY